MEAHVRDEWPRYTEEPVTDLPVHPLAPKLNVEQEPGCEIDVHFENEFSDLGQHWNGGRGGGGGRMLTDGLLNFLFDIKLAFLCIPEYSSRGWYLLLFIIISYLLLNILIYYAL